MKKYLKSLLLLVVALLVVIPTVKANAADKVKVYMFEAGGCPYCEAEEEYLKGLDGYGKTFELIKKELYVDHVDWKQGKDYELGKKVAEAFQKVGFDQASYQGTPFVVVSDIYAVAAYNPNLEETIKEAIEKGDKDIVGCYESGKDNCLKHLEKKSETSTSTSNTDIIIWTVSCTVIIAVAYFVKSTIDKKEILAAIEANKKSK